MIVINKKEKFGGADIFLIPLSPLSPPLKFVSFPIFLPFPFLPAYFTFLILPFLPFPFLPIHFLPSPYPCNNKEVVCFFVFVYTSSGIETNLFAVIIIGKVPCENMKDFLYLKRGRRGSFIRYEMMINVIVISRKSKSGLKKDYFNSLFLRLCVLNPPNASHLVCSSVGW